MTEVSSKVAEDLYESFKSKVNEAIILVQHLPETWKHEALKFWKEVSRTVEKLESVYVEKEEICAAQDVTTFLHFDNTFDDVIVSSAGTSNAKVGTERIDDSNVVISWPRVGQDGSVQEESNGAESLDAVSIPPQSQVSIPDDGSEYSQSFQLDISKLASEAFASQNESNHKDISDQIEVLVLNSKPLRELNEKDACTLADKPVEGKERSVSRKRQKRKPKQIKKEVQKHDKYVCEDGFSGGIVLSSDMQTQIPFLKQFDDNICVTTECINNGEVIIQSPHHTQLSSDKKSKQRRPSSKPNRKTNETKENLNTCLTESCKISKTNELSTSEFDLCPPSNVSEANDHDYVAQRQSRRKRKFTSKYKDMVCKAEGHVGDGDATVGVRKRERQPKPESFTCSECGDKLSSATALLAHSRRHNGERPFSCLDCGKNFTTKGNLSRHLKSHVGEKPYQCSVCEKNFTEKRTLEVHMRTHTGLRPYKCTECSMAFSQSGVLKTHMYTHTGHKGHLCDYCGKAFRQKSQLRTHTLRHENKRLFKCETCDASFITRGDLQRHNLRHTNERPFSCTICPKTFTRKQYLKEHMNMHSGQKPYFCKSCGMSFPDMSNYYRHMKKHKIKLKKEEEDQIEEVEETAMDNSVNNEGDNTEITTFNLNNEQIRIHFSESDLNMNIPPEQSSEHVANETTSEVYEVTEVDGNSAHSNSDQSTQLIITTVDFSAINLLANATTQFTLP